MISQNCFSYCKDYLASWCQFGWFWSVRLFFLLVCIPPWPSIQIRICSTLVFCPLSWMGKDLDVLALLSLLGEVHLWPSRGNIFFIGLPIPPKVFLVALFSSFWVPITHLETVYYPCCGRSEFLGRLSSLSSKHYMGESTLWIAFRYTFLPLLAWVVVVYSL